ncbi:hypothetical protein D3C87_1985000 [compost metagenome]
MKHLYYFSFLHLMKLNIIGQLNLFFCNDLLYGFLQLPGCNIIGHADQHPVIPFTAGHLKRRFLHSKAWVLFSIKFPEAFEFGHYKIFAQGLVHKF